MSKKTYLSSSVDKERCKDESENEVLIASPLTGYVGGKLRLAPKIISLMKDHKWYMEVFAGMASVFLTKGKVARNLINDINGNLINLFRVVRDKPDEFIRKIELTPYSSEEFFRFVNLYKNQEEFAQLSDVDRAFVYYYVLDNAFNSLISKHITFSPSLSGAKSWASDGRLVKIWKLARYLQGVEITNYSYEVLLSYPWIWENADKWLIYCDPPYFVSTEKDDYYEFRFSVEDHIKLNKLLNKLKSYGIAIIVSYDDHQFIKDLYKDWELVVIPDVVQSSSARDGNPVSRNELIFLSYSIYELGLFSINFEQFVDKKL